MGKIPHAMRGARFPMTTIMKTSQPQSPTQSSTTPIHLLKKKTHFPKKIQPSKQPQSPISQITLSSSNLTEAKKIFTSLVSTNTPFDTPFYNSLLQSFSSVSSVQDSLSLFRYMTKTHPAFEPDRGTYHILLSQSCKSVEDGLANVHQVLNLMVSDRVAPDHVTTDIAVRSLCGGGREEHAIELVKELSVKYSPPDGFTFNFIVRHLCKNRDMSTVYKFVKDMRESFDVKPDLVTYTILINSVCNGKNMREATRLLKELGDAGFKPDCFLYNTIMKGYCIMNLGGEAIGVYNKMKDEGVEPDLVTYNTLIFGLSKSGRVKEARKLLNVMVSMGHFPDAVTYTSLMNGMCRENNSLGALGLLIEMEEKGCAPNECTYNTLIHGLCKSRLLEKGLELFEVMKSSNMKLESASYATLIRVLCRAGRIGEAYEVFDYVVVSKSLKDVVAYSTLETMLKSLEKLREKGLAV